MGQRMVHRLGVIGDVHTEADNLARAIEHLQGFSPDLLVCTGDLVDGPGGGPEVDRCCALLREHEVLTVHGNHDRWMQDEEMRDLPGATERFDLTADTLAFIASLPMTASLDTTGGRLLLCHGLGDDDMASLTPHQHAADLERNEPLQALLRAREYRFVVSGHSHKRMVREVEGMVFVNAGSLLRDHRPCCALVDAGQELARFFDIAPDGEISEAPPPR